MEKTCPHCSHGISAVWHKKYGIQKLVKGGAELGIPVVGRVGVRKEMLAVVYICELTNLPFLVTVEKAR
jgi:hypothetical protein